MYHDHHHHHHGVILNGETNVLEQSVNIQGMLLECESGSALGDMSCCWMYCGHFSPVSFAGSAVMRWKEMPERRAHTSPTRQIINHVVRPSPPH